MLKKLSAVFLIVTSWLMLTPTLVQADAAPPIGLLELDPSCPKGELCFLTPTPTSSSIVTELASSLLLISLPLYLIVFTFNYTIEYCVGSLMGLSEYKRFGRTVLLMNLITHPLLTLGVMIFFQFFRDNYFLLWLAEFWVVLIETVIIWQWCHPQRTNQAPNSVVFVALVYCTIANLTSFLVGMFISSIAPFSGFVLSDRPFQSDALYYQYCVIATIVIALPTWILHLIRRKLTPPSQSA